MEKKIISMKKIILSIVFVLLMSIFAYQSVTVFAAQTGFNITANWSYGQVSTANTKLDHNLLAYVNWQSSSETSHKEWFQVVNSNAEARSSEVLFSYLGSGYISEYSSVLKGYNYYLRARREHIVNASTRVTGQWES